MGTVLAIVGSILSIAVSIAVTCVVVVRLPADHFVGPPTRAKSMAARIGRNIGGALLIALGIVLSFPGIPGQGILTILLGIMCLDVPGKRRAELWLVKKPSVHRAIDSLRRRYGKVPLELPGEDDGGGVADPVASGVGARAVSGGMGVSELATATGGDAAGAGASRRASER
jgi:hypothetical protein